MQKEPSISVLRKYLDTLSIKLLPQSTEANPLVDPVDLVEKMNFVEKLTEDAVREYEQLSQEKTTAEHEAKQLAEANVKLKMQAAGL